MRVVSAERELQAILRQDFPSFIAKVFQTLSPGQTLVRSWVLEALAYHLEQVRLGNIRRLIIAMPPRSLKSTVASVAFPAFVHCHDPTKRIICVSYSNDLAKKFSNDYRALIDNEWYRKLAPATRIGRFKDSEVEIELTARGSRLATSTHGTLTGRGGDIIVIDDPLKPIDALSETRRSAANDWYSSTLRSRLDDPVRGAIVIVAQRIHVDDLIGYVLGGQEGWTVLNLSAIAERKEEILVGEDTRHTRRVGELLFPDRMPLEELEKLRLEIGSDIFSAQYQQAPRAARRRNGQAPLDQALHRTAEESDSHPAELGYGPEGRARQRLVGLHDVGADGGGLVSPGCLAPQSELSGPQSHGEGPRAEMEGQSGVDRRGGDSHRAD
jgi:hypothetical protein